MFAQFLLDFFQQKVRFAQVLAFSKVAKMEGEVFVSLWASQGYFEPSRATISPQSPCSLIPGVWILLIGICAKYVLRCPLHVESDLRCVLQRHNVSLANIRDWNTSTCNICLFYYFYALYSIFISSGGYFTVNKYVLRCPIQIERPPIINMCTPKT